MNVTGLHDAHETALAQRQQELTAHVERCESALRQLRRGVVLDATGHVASPQSPGAAVVGVARDLVESRSRLAQVRRDLRRLDARGR